MPQQYQFPFQIFLILEKVEPIVYTSEYLTPNHYVVILPKNYIYMFNIILKKEVYYNMSFLSEISSIDTLKYNEIIPELNLEFKKNRFLTYYIYYLLFIKTRITLFCYNNNDNIYSIEKIYKNSIWLERENSEMFGTHYIFKNDYRNLLLDYSRTEHPMLKDFPCEGYQDIYYDFFENEVVYLNHTFIEL